MTLLAVDNLSVAYGDLYAVREVSFALDEHAAFVLLGANGAGKDEHPAGHLRSGAQQRR